MPGQAKVLSIEAVQAQANALHAFSDEAIPALDDLQTQIRRALEWVGPNRKQYWTEQVRRGWEKVTESQVQLQQAMTFRRVADHRPTCIDEKRAVEAAKRRLSLAQEKVEAVRRWTQLVEHAFSEFQAAFAQFSGWLGTDLPRGLAALGRMADSLEAYVGVVGPGEPSAQPAAAPSTEPAEPPPADRPHEEAAP